MSRCAVEQRQGGDIPRGAVKGILLLTMEKETEPVLDISNYNNNSDETDPGQHVIMYFSKKAGKSNNTHK